ncbi:MAG TPA: prepilin peptidase [Fimbriimonadaceae bacterium]|nr:prepilin peptidase [Fimbriimonadaceae bacterium]
MKGLIPLPPWTILLGFAFGAIVGSFLNVVIYRMPRAKSLSNPKHSFCPKCGHQLGVPDLFPLFSWLVSGRKCRYCGQPVSSRYFWVEMFNGLIWMGVWYQYLLGPNPDLPKAIAYALAAAALVAIIFIDIELYLIPDQINAFIFFIGIGYNLWLYSENSSAATTWGMPSSVAGALTGVGVIWGIALFGRIVFRKDAMGHGDIKMARGTGAVLFPALAGISFGLAVFLGAVLGLVQVFLRPKASTPLPPSSVSRASGGAAGRAGGREETEEGGRAPGSADDRAGGREEIEEGEEYAPESIGSLLKCGVGYILCLDIVGLFVPKFYKSYFGEDPFLPPDDLETFEADRTMIPFGPYLALGAILAAVFERQLLDLANAYLRSMGATPAFFWNTF